MFSIRIVTTDHYQADPIPGLDVQYSDFRGSDVRKVPVVRVFGSTAGGQKTCMHVHGVFPYMYVPYDGTQPWDRYLRQFASSLDKAINVAQGNANSNFQHVYKVTLVSGVPMYGYHSKEQQFLKIYFYNPNIIRKVADLLLGGAVMNKVFQPHESHIPYTLQLFIDYNLYGMNMLNVAAVKFRRNSKDLNANPVNEILPGTQGSDGDISTSRTHQSIFQDSILNSSVSNSQCRSVWNSDNIPCDLYLDSSVVKQSVCELEVDVVAADILNRLEVDANIGTNPGLAALWEDERQRRRNHGESSQITPPDSQEHDNVVTAESNQIWMDRLNQIILDQEPYMDSQSDSVSESSQDDLSQIPDTQASEVELHLSQREGTASQDTLMMDDSDDDEPVINVESIHRVLSTSQSFIGSQPTGSGEVQDKSLAQILASLAGESSPEASQETVGQIAVLEEKDSILQDKPILPDEDTEKVDEHETLEMSQQVWEGDDSQGEGQNEVQPDGQRSGYNLEGMDETWEESQLMLRLETDSEDDEPIPQLDGAGDEKPVQERPKKKRLGVRGPVYQRLGQSSNVSQQGQGQMMFDDRKKYDQEGKNQIVNQHFSQQMINPQQTYEQYDKYQNSAWNQQDHQQQQDGSNMGLKTEWDQNSSTWMGTSKMSPTYERVHSNQPNDLTTLQAIPQHAQGTLQQNIHVQQTSSQQDIQSRHGHVSPQSGINYPNSSSCSSHSSMQPIYTGTPSQHCDSKPVYGSNWSHHGDNNMSLQAHNQSFCSQLSQPGQSRPPSAPLHSSHLYNQSSHNYNPSAYRNYMSPQDNQSSLGGNQHDHVPSPHSNNESPHGHTPSQNQSSYRYIYSQRDVLQSPYGYKSPQSQGSYTPMHNAAYSSYQNVTSPHGNVTSPEEMTPTHGHYSSNSKQRSVTSPHNEELSPMEMQQMHGQYTTTPRHQRSLSFPSETSHRSRHHQQFSPGMDVSQKVKNQEILSGSNYLSKTKNITSKMSGHDQNHGTSPSQQHPCSLLPYPSTDNSNMSSGEICPSQQNFCSPRQRTPSQDDPPSTLERLLFNEDSQDLNISSTPLRCSSRGSINSNKSGQSLMSENTDIPLPSSGQLSINGASAFSPSDSQNESHMQDSVCSVTVSSDANVKETPRVKYLTPEDLVDYEPSTSLTTLTKLQSLVSNVPSEKLFGSSLEKCVNARICQNRKQGGGGGMSQSSSYPAWNDSENVHYQSENNIHPYQQSRTSAFGSSSQDNFLYRSQSVGSIDESGFYFGSGRVENVVQPVDHISQTYHEGISQNLGEQSIHGKDLIDLDAHKHIDLDAHKHKKPIVRRGSWNDRYQQMIHMNSSQEMPQYGSPYSQYNAPGLNRSLSMPVIEKKKRGRPKGFKVNKSKPTPTTSTPKAKNLSYTFTFHVPTPIFKRLKLKQACQKLSLKDNVNIVRMHPMDARRYSLLKIGREVVKITKLRTEDIQKYRRSPVNGEQLNQVEKLFSTDYITDSCSPECLQVNKNEDLGTMEDIFKENGNSTKLFFDDDSESQLNRINNTNKTISTSEESPEYTLLKHRHKVKEQHSENNGKNFDRLNNENTSFGDRSFHQENARNNMLEENIKEENFKDDCLEKAPCQLSENLSGYMKIENANANIKGSQNNQEEISRNVQENDYERIAALTLNSVIDRVVEQSIERKETVDNVENISEKCVNENSSLQNLENNHLLNSTNENNQISPTNPRENIVQYVTSDMVVFNQHRNSVENILSQTSSQRKTIGDSEKNSTCDIGVLNSSEAKGQNKAPFIPKIDIAAPFPDSKKKLFHRKRNILSKLNPNPFLLDPDPDDIHHIVLKDVNLTEASEGTLTPIKSRTPVAGRSPIRAGFGNDQYKLFDSELISNRDDLVSKLGSFVSDLDISEQTNRIFATDLLSEKEHSSSESTVSSNSDIHCQGFLNGDSDRERKRKARILNRLTSDFNENYIGITDFYSKRRKISTTHFSSENTSSEKSLNSSSEKKLKKNKIPKVEYIIVGKFKGHKRMAVKLDKVNIDSDCVHISDVVSQKKIRTLNSHINHKETYIKDDAKRKMIYDEDRTYHEKMCLIDDKMSKFNESIKQDPSFENIDDGHETKLNENEVKNAVKNIKNESKFEKSEEEPSLWWLQPGSTDFSGTDSSSKSRKSKLSLSKKRCEKTEKGTKSQLPNSVLSESEVTDGLKLMKDKLTEQNKNPELTVIKKESEDSDGTKSPKIDSEDSDGTKSPVIPLSGEENCKIKNENGHNMTSSVENDQSATENSSNGQNKTSYEKWNCIYQPQNSCQVGNEMVSESVTQFGRNDKNGEICENINNSDESSKSWCNSEKDDWNSSRDIDMKQSFSDSDSRSSSLDGISSNLNGKLRGNKQKKKKSLTRNQRLQVAFVSTKSKRRKTSNACESKLMNSLSLLHEATLANLNEPADACSDDIEDYKINYQDAMTSMAFLSPPDSEKGNNSPPQPLSPEEIEKDQLNAGKFAGDDSKLQTASISQGNDRRYCNPLLSKKHHLSQLHIKIEELRKKQMEKLKDLELSKLHTSIQPVSLECIYETPLSSVESPTRDLSKSPECLKACDSECIYVSSATDSDEQSQNKEVLNKGEKNKKCVSVMEFNNSMRKNLTPAEKEFVKYMTNISDDRYQSFLQINSGRDLATEAKENMKNAVVRVKRLSAKEIRIYCRKNPGVGQKSKPSCIKRKRSVSPPDLGPPHIPRISSENEQNKSISSSPPLLIDSSTPKLLIDSSTPPLLIDSSAPKLNISDVLELDVDKPDLFYKSSPSKSPASSSSSSFNVVHSDIFSDISDDEEMDEAVTNTKNDSQVKTSFSSNILPGQLSSGINDVVLNTVVKLTGEPNQSATCSVNEKLFSSDSQNVGEKCDIKIIEDQRQHTLENPKMKSDMEENEQGNAASQNVCNSVCLTESGADTDPSKTTSKQGPDPNEKQQNMQNKYSTLVVKPQKNAPSRKLVTETAVTYGLDVLRNQDAFCSNPDDLPEKPRELGGRILKVQSNRIKDLNEFESSVKCNGLDTWRNLFTSNDVTFLSQSDNTSLMTKINEQPSLRFAILGDRNIVISPCKPPPSKKKVKIWCKGRKIYKSLKNSAKAFSFDKIQKNVNKTDKDKFESNERSESKYKKNEFDFLSDDSFEIIKGSEGKTENLKVKLVRRKSQGSVRFCDNSLNSYDNDTELDKDVEHVKDVNNEKLPDSEEIIDLTQDSKKESIEPGLNTENDIISPSPPKGLIRSKWKSKMFKSYKVFKQRNTDGGNLHSTPVCCRDTNIQQDDASDKSLCSTPIQKRNSNDLFEVGFTPINSEKGVKFKSRVGSDIMHTPISEQSSPATVVEKESAFVTPKDIPLSKRLSTAADQTAGTSSQIQDFSTPGNQKAFISQIDGPTPKNSFGFKVSQHNLQDAKALHEVQNLTVISLEVHTETRRELRPDPEIDAILAVFFCIHNDVSPEKGIRELTGAIIVDKQSAEYQASCRSRRKRKHTGDNDDESHDTGSSPEPSTSTGLGSKVRPASPHPSTSHDYSVPSSSHHDEKRRGDSKDSADCGTKSDITGNTLLQKSGVDYNLDVTYVSDEQELFKSFIALISEWDPDILVGYEIQMLSWGYLLQRAAHCSIDLCKKMSRIPESKTGSHFSAQKDEWGADHSSEIHIVGRIVLNLWRLLRHEVALNVYTFENVAFHVLHQRIPLYSYKALNSWFNHRTHLYRWRVIHHYITRVKGNMQIIDQLDLIGRTSEFARVFGIEFYHVLSRGSQYRVESMMLRLAKPLNFIPVSPSVHQRARMKAPECIPLTLEPESKFYPDPVVVLDFQSLYPSIMIAYNYCFSTCLGRVDWLKKAHEGPIEFGCTSVNVPPSVLKKLKNDVTVSPNGVAFVKQHVRKGVISAMVEEILNTRLMVKKAMKEYKNDKGLHRLLDARQLGLKLIANVTYGYTGANFSGRMPCIEVGDSIVRKARETLERAIKLVEDTPKWGAKVVYGDTDSLFILLKGRSKDEAFKIGYEICDAVTNMNPKPIKLKFEKVYLPCALETKKRYVGFMYETPDQKEPVYDAKGIETVRRDSCSAVSKMLEKSIKILFTSRDVSQVKQYVQTQCRKLMEGKVSMQDCIFAKEYRGMSGYKPGACVPALEIAKKMLRQDRRSEPRVGERVPYVIVYGTPGLPLIKLVRQPMELIIDPTLRINATYYITKQILPPLNRLLSLVGVDVFTWYNEMPKFIRIVPHSIVPQDTKKGTISQYFSAVNCPVCDAQTNQSICNKCMSNPQTVAISLNTKIRHWEKVYHDLVQVCNSCMRTQDENQPCISVDCPIFFRRVVANLDVSKGTQLREVVKKTLDF